MRWSRFMRGPCHVGKREKYDELGAIRIEVPRAQLPAERTRDVVGDHQAKAEALPCRLGGDERLEQALQDTGGDRRAAVANGDAALGGRSLVANGADLDGFLLGA